MTTYVVRRLVMAVVTVVVISMLTFLIIQLPEGDFVDSYVRELESFGANVSLKEADHLREIWGLNRPLPVQYFKWITQLLQGNLGTSFSMQHHRPVREIIADRLVMTVVLAGCSLVFTWIVALPIGIYSAVRQRTLGDYTATVVGYFGLATPDFLLALAIMYWAFLIFDTNLGGLFSDEYLDAPWSLARLWDLLKHLPIPTAIVGLTGTAGLIRIMRANLLDELRKPYVVTARSKGMTEGRLIAKYPVRLALNPFASTVGYILPQLVSGSIFVALVMSLPTLAPVLYQALLRQDMLLAGNILLMVSILTVIGTFLSDLVLLWIDPRIRVGAR